MTVFSGYTLDKLWKTPFVHIISLYTMALQQNACFRYNVAQGFNGSQSQEGFDALKEGLGVTVYMDKKYSAAIQTEENMRKAQSIAEQMSKGV